MSAATPPLPQRLRGQGLRVLAAVVAWLLRLIAASWRIEYRGTNPFAEASGAQSVVAVTWHRNLLLGAALFRDSGIHVPVSQSRDGERIAAVMARLGLGAPPRGSSSRGGSAALREMLRLVRSGRHVTLLADGPRGPAGVAKPGVVALARLSGRAIHPLALSAAPSVRFGSWDGSLLPLPFARVICHFGAPFAVEADSARREPDEDSQALGRTLEALTEALDRELGLR